MVIIISIITTGKSLSFKNLERIYQFVCTPSFTISETDNTWETKFILEKRSTWLVFLEVSVCGC